MAFLAIRITGIFVTVFAMNNDKPKGGVRSPSVVLSAIMTPRWTGSTPTAVSVGSIMGAVIKIDEIPSIKQPIINSAILTSNRSRYLLSVRPINISEIILGTFSNVIIYEKQDAIAKIAEQLPNVFPVFTRIAGISFHFSSL